MAKRDCTDLPGILLCKAAGTFGRCFPRRWNKAGRKSTASSGCDCSKCSGISCCRGGIFQSVYGKILEYQRGNFPERVWKNSGIRHCVQGTEDIMIISCICLHLWH